MLEYGIGSTEVKTEANESISEIPQNRTLMIEQLTIEAPVSPEIVHGLTTIDEVFQKFNPNVEVDFEDSEGVVETEKLTFKSLGDFGTKGITRQSKFLRTLNEQQDQFYQLVKQLKKNKLLRKALSQEETKEALLTAIYSMIKELENENK